MLQEAIRALIEDKLNDNTENLKFIVGSYVYLSDKEQGFVYNVRNGYTLIERDFIATLIDFTAEYQPMPTQINGTATINTSFTIISIDQETTDTYLSAVNEIVSKVVGNNETITDGSDTYNSVWNMTALMPIGTTLINGNYYTEVRCTIYIDFSNTNHYGNEYEYTINGTRVYPYDISVGRNQEENNPHLLGDTEAKGGMETSAWSSTQTFYVNDFISAIVDTLSSDTYNMEQVYRIVEKTPTNTTGTTIDVKIKSVSYKPILGEKTLITFVFIKSDDEYSS